LPFTLALADKGYARACRENPHLLAGLNIHRGALTYQAVAEAQKREFTPTERALPR
jgi:alanine dehydrogenase